MVVVLAQEQEVLVVLAVVLVVIITVEVVQLHQLDKEMLEVVQQLQLESDLAEEDLLLLVQMEVVRLGLFHMMV